MQVHTRSKGAALRCPYCRDTLVFNKTLCSKCRTASHQDCWNEHGKCPVCSYDKGSNQYLSKRPEIWNRPASELTGDTDYFAVITFTLFLAFLSFLIILIACVPQERRSLTLPSLFREPNNYKELKNSSSYQNVLFNSQTHKISLKDGEIIKGVIISNSLAALMVRTQTRVRKIKHYHIQAIYLYNSYISKE